MNRSRQRDAFVEDVLHDGDAGVGASLLRCLLTPLAFLHRVGLETYLLPYRSGLRKRYRLPVPVIAIGNLSSGGTGKTPMAALVAGRLQAKGLRVVLLSRGHGGSHEGDRAGPAARVVSDGTRLLLGPDEAGDEPVLLGRLLPGVPVVVGRDRRRTGRYAVERFAPDVVVLDDALQFWQLHRDLDIVLLDARRPFDNGHILPRGLLREPPSHLSRAGIVVLTRADRVSPEQRDRTIEAVQKLAPRAAVFTATHAPIGWVAAAGSDIVQPLDAFADRPVLAFSGIADGDAFARTVESCGARVTSVHRFPDHFVYDAASVRLLSEAAVRESVATVVTTEKDIVKVATRWPPQGPALYALRIGMKIDDEARFVQRIGECVMASTKEKDGPSI